MKNNPVNWVDPYGLSAMAWAVPVAGVLALVDSPVLPFGDAVGGALIGIAWLIDNMPDDDEIEEIQQEMGLGGSGNPCPKKRSPYPPARRNKSKSKKDAYEKAKKAGKGKEPIHHPDGEHGPHYHPDVPMPKPDQMTPKMPNPHDHYYYPK